MAASMINPYGNVVSMSTATVKSALDDYVSSQTNYTFGSLVLGE
jgi:hypothetical protein